MPRFRERRRILSKLHDPVHDRLIREHFRSRLILQVHDELLIETAEEEKEKVIALLEEEMQKAADLKVELAVGTACGQDWYEAH